MRLFAAYALITVGCAQVLGIQDPAAGSGSGSQNPDGGTHDGQGQDATSGSCGAALRFGSASQFPAAQNSWFEVGDLDHDGKPDLVIANLESPALTIWHGGPSTTFVDMQGITPPGPCNAVQTVRIIDLDGDGYNDMVAVACGALWFYRQQSASAGNFDSPIQLATYNLPVPLTGGVAFGDFNGDQIVDIALASGSGVSTLIQSASTRGTFVAGPTSQVSVNGQASYISIVAGDFNGDGKNNDIAVGTNGMISLLTATGATFAPMGAVGSGGATSFGGGLLDAGSAMDLAAIGSPSTVYLQSVPPTFTAVALATPAEGKTGVFLDDADGDGIPDIVSDGIVNVNCGGATSGHAFTGPQSLGEQQLTRFASVTFDPKPLLIYYSPSAAAIIVEHRQ